MGEKKKTIRNILMFYVKFLVTCLYLKLLIMLQKPVVLLNVVKSDKVQSSEKLYFADVYMYINIYI